MSRLRKPQNRLPASYYRGGTSRAIIFDRAHLPPDQTAWSPIFRSAIGSPDPNGRQLDGLGGGISSLSKICIVSAPSVHPDAHVDYTFVALGVKTDEVDYSSNCGNMTSAIGPFAVDNGLVTPPADADEVTIKIHNTNTGKLVHATFPLTDGEACAYGDFAIDGVAGTAAPVRLDFIDPAGAKTGNMLPTGVPVDVVDGFSVTCIDVGNPAVFVRAVDFAVPGSITPDAVDAHPTLLRDLDRVRRKAAVKMGIGETEAAVPGSIPKICLVACPETHELPSGGRIERDEIDVMLRALSVGQPHRAVPVTVALAAAAAAKVGGSVVHDLVARASADPRGITLGHASGKLLVDAKFGENQELKSVGLFRTARRLFEGNVYWK